MSGSFNHFKEKITHHWFMLIIIITIYKYMKVYQFLHHLKVGNYETVSIK